MSKVTNNEDFRARWQDEHAVLSGDGNPVDLVALADVGVRAEGEREA